MKTFFRKTFKKRTYHEKVKLIKVKNLFEKKKHLISLTNTKICHSISKTCRRYSHLSEMKNKKKIKEIKEVREKWNYVDKKVSD